MGTTRMAGFRPQLEALEDRQLLAASTMVLGQTLWITGDKNTNVVVINDNGSGAAANLTGTVDGVAFNALTAGVAINRVYMNLGKGNDFVNYNMTADAVGATMRVDAFLFNGNDAFNLNVGANGFFGNSTYFFKVDGGEGRDTIQATMQNATGFFNVGNGSSIGMRFLGGDDEDTIGFQYSGEADGLVNFWADGGRDEDTVGAIVNIFNDAGFVPGRYWIQIYGGSGRNTLGLRVFDFDPNTNDAIIALLDGGKEKNIAVVTTNVLLQNFKRDSTIWFLPQPVVTPLGGGGGGA